MTRNAAHLLEDGAVFAAIVLACLLAFGGMKTPVALADEEPTEAQLTALQLQQEIEARQADYAAARGEADAASAAIAETQARIEELEREIPEQQERSAQAARELYKLQNQSTGVVNLLLTADSFYSFLAELEYIDRIAAASTDEMARLAQLKQEIVNEQNGLKDAQREADARAENARAAMEAAQEAQAEVQRRIEEEARQQAELAAMAAALAEQERVNDQATTGSSSSGSGKKKASSSSGDSGASSEATAESAGSGTSGDAGASTPATEPEPEPEPETASDPGVSSSDDSLAGWTARIDAYLAGSPLAGQGATFAKAALDYGVDPRLSPAISFTESGKGANCFRSHNAWGWGSSSWGSWEEAINAHVGGLARGYGGQLTIEGAKKYCPPNWQLWYNRTKAQMELI